MKREANEKQRSSAKGKDPAEDQTQHQHARKIAEETQEAIGRSTLKEKAPISAVGNGGLQKCHSKKSRRSRASVDGQEII